ncbi:hypothetical protein [Pseudomonas oryzihabitans]|uniref:hypothetical protein n=1 Tax=Pseudomonas oryzihabitans TaxID=47885 RepID=UPI002897EE6B|nr:hypothetical protein [Pseudomonas oryzihabitans]
MSEMNSFQDAFYIMAKELGFDYAQPLSPREVFETQMLPRIRELVTARPAAGEPVAWMIDWPDEPELGHYFSESPDELTGSRSRPLFTVAPPAAAHGGISAEVLSPFLAVADAYDPAEDDAYVPAKDWMMDDALRLTLGQFRALKRAAAHGDEAPGTVRVTADWLKMVRRDLDACQKVIWLAGCRPHVPGGFDPAYCEDAQARLKEIDEQIARAQAGEGVDHE